jgi:hypothetical protein
MYRSIVLAAFVFLSGPVTSLGGAIELPQGKVNWEGGYVQGVGTGTARVSGNKAKDRMMAIRAAEVLAQRALAETIHGIRVDGSTTMRDAMRDYVVSSQVQGVIRGAQKVREEVIWDGDVPMATVELRICLVADAPQCRSASSLVNALPLESRKEPVFVPAVYFEDVTDAGKPEGKPKETQKTGTVSYDSSRPVTGLVLELGGLCHEKELFPVVVTRLEEGNLQTVFSARNVKPDVVRTHGVARYADSVDQALKDTRLGDNPMVVGVSEVTKENMLLVRVEGARAIRESARYGNDYLGEAKVVIAGIPRPTSRGR